MATKPGPEPEPGVQALMADLLGGEPAGRGTTLWRLAGPERQLDANVIRLAPGAGVAQHVEPSLDVLLYVTDGGGKLGARGAAQVLRPGSLVWLPRGTARSVTAGPDGLAYVTVHRRRPGLTVGSAPPDRAEPEGGEAACLLHRVCPACGRLAGEPDARFCVRCGSALPTDLA